jgi:nuclear pore complex protein Nup98-Nup96
MTLDELRSVENLKLSNELGSVEFLGKTDISEVDFSDVVTISKGSVEVYNEERHKDCYPKVGEKLNRPAIITLKNIKPKDGQTGTDKELKLRSIMEKGGGEHISYDKETFTWTFKVQHFTRWGEGDEEPSNDSSSNLNGKSDAEF